LQFPNPPEVLVGLNVADDAGVYQLDDRLALVQTVDFFTPIVDDPYTFGRIAAVNALSDVYAMGGRPLCAMNIVCFPRDELGLDVLRETLRGGLDTCTAAGVAVVGGHSVNDPEFKYGLSVTGRVDPGRVWTKRGAQPGDRLLLTKPLGNGAIATAIKRELATPDQMAAAIGAMLELNRAAAEVLQRFAVHAATDVTGFGLIGHAAEMIEGQPVGFAIDVAAVPLLTGALELANAGVLPGGLDRNRDYRAAMVDAEPGLAAARVDLLYDPQTSGGLLVAIPAAQCSDALAALQAAGVARATAIGEVTRSDPGRIALR
jgi:selenide, water dikinase